MKPFDVYSVWDIEPVSAEGCFLCDASGNKYLDMYGGHAVISVGHSHPRYIKALETQLKKIGFYSNSVKNGIQDKFAELLGQIAGYEHYSLFMCNSGAEANENALKLASFHNSKKRIVSFKNSFHGRTFAAVNVTDTLKLAPMNEGRLDVTFLELNDIESVRKELKKGDVSSIIIEGIQGIGGIYTPDNQFMQELRTICTETNTVLILDEIQSGYGRSGQFFAHQYAEIKPDIITVAKGICNGFPMGGVLISPMFKAVHGQLGTTFGGNHLGCAGAIAVLEIIEEERLIENAAKVGDFLISELKKFPGIKEIRGFGLMIGLEFEQPIKEIRSKLLFEQKVFTGVAGAHIIRLLPPLSLSMDEAEEFLVRFKKCL